MLMFSTASCGRGSCQAAAVYRLAADNLPLCRSHAAQICDTDIVVELYHPLVIEILEATAWKRSA
jgi:hypothetical protein